MQHDNSKTIANNCPGFENDEIIREVTKVNFEFYHAFGGNWKEIKLDMFVIKLFI